MMTRLAGAALLAAMLPLSAHAQAPTQPPVPAVTEQGEEMDSGVGDLETADWIGKPVTSSDGREIGTLREVRMASDTADSGLLVVDREGGATAEIPMQGASFDGRSVVVTPLYDAIVSN